MSQLDQRCKKALTANRRDLLSTIEPIDNGLLDTLLEKEVLAQNEYDVIAAEKTTTQQNTQLLKYVVKFSQEKFNTFIEALYDCNQEAIANLLDKEHVARYKAQKTGGVPQPVHNPGNIQAGNVQATGGSVSAASARKPDIVLTDSIQLDLHVFHSDPNCYETTKHESYSIEYPKRGRLLVINNQYQREGTDIDIENINNLFEKFGFDVQIYNDNDGLKSQDMLTKIEEFAKHPDNKQTAMVAICIMAHGKSGGFQMSEDRKCSSREIVQYGDIYKLFSNNSAKDLQGKPKMFFVQACRGDEVDYGVVQSDSSTITYQTISDQITAFATQDGFCAGCSN